MQCKGCSYQCKDTNLKAIHNNAWVEEITPDVESITNDFVSKGGIVTRPKGGSTGGSVTGADNPYLKARIAEQEKAPATSAIVGGLPK